MRRSPWQRLSGVSTRQRDALGLTEGKIRGAIRTLEEIGFLDRVPVDGSTHRETTTGELHRKPVQLFSPVSSLRSPSGGHIAKLAQKHRLAERAEAESRLAALAREPVPLPKLSTAALMAGRWGG